MKKLTIMLCACTILAGCSGPKTDFDKAAAIRAEKRDMYRQEYGCSFSDDHAAYRQCLLNTYSSTHPKTYETKRGKEGQSVAVIRSDDTRESYDEETRTYKTERVIVIETEEHLEPVSGVTANIPYTITPLREEAEPVKDEAEPLDSEFFLEEDVYDDTVPEDVLTEPKTVQRNVDAQIKQVEPKPDPSTALATEVAPKKTKKKETWWDTYQNDKPQTEEEPVCPCPDPNEPCPQCVDK